VMVFGHRAAGTTGTDGAKVPLAGEFAQQSELVQLRIPLFAARNALDAAAAVCPAYPPPKSTTCANSG
jgi:hypothetical protein